MRDWRDEAPEWRLLADTKQAARKWYPCQACPLEGLGGGGMIPPGQSYRKIVGLSDGKLETHRECVGACPNADPCAACNATGEADEQHNYCHTCGGTGKVRRRHVEKPREPGEADHG